MRIVFWTTVVLIVFTYFGYPLLMLGLLRFKRQRPIDKKRIEPDVSLVIPAYNEEKSIRDKLENVLALNYPAGKIKIIVVSDASSDRTDEIVERFRPRGVTLLRMERRNGKIAAYRRALPHLKGEIIVFSDATSILDREAIAQLVGNFNDPSVGCVGGLLRYVNPGKAMVGEGESQYWSYEKKIREYESRLSSLTSVSGTLYAVRKNLYPGDMKEDLADDFIVPSEVKKKGFRVVLEPEAVCIERAVHSTAEEMAKRIRITLQNIRGLLDRLEILNPFKYGVYSILVISHKLFRLLVPVFLMVLFVSNAVLAFGSKLFLVLLLLQALFYLTAVIGYFLNKKLKLKIVESVYYFCLSNLAILIGILRFFKGKKVVTWEPMR
ncbi:MAG TPA: glycosyltransferase family 2 protein [Nitrospiria bacterium]